MNPDTADYAVHRLDLAHKFLDFNLTRLKSAETIEGKSHYRKRVAHFSAEANEAFRLLGLPQRYDAHGEMQ